jgi:hypothetical protein
VDTSAAAECNAWCMCVFFFSFFLEASAFCGCLRPCLFRHLSFITSPYTIQTYSRRHLYSLLHGDTIFFLRTFARLALFCCAWRRHNIFSIKNILVLERSKYGLVLHTGGVDGEEFVAHFYYDDDEGQKMEKIFRFAQNFPNTTLRLLPLGEESMQLTHICKKGATIKNVWGLVVENAAGGFHCEGCYTVRSVALLPCGKDPVHSSFEMNFISTSAMLSGKR